MTSSVFMIVLILACFLAAVLNLASDSRFRRGFMRFAILTAVCSGAFFYGYGYAHTLGISVVSVIRALMALCRMFGGVNDLASIQAAPIFQYPAALALFWFAHFLAFYVTASAAIATLGERLLRRIRVTLLRKGPLLLIYGLNPRSVAYGRRMAGRHERSVLFVDADSNPALESAVKSFGGVVEKSADALSASPHFLRQVNMKAAGARRAPRRRAQKPCLCPCLAGQPERFGHLRRPDSAAGVRHRGGSRFPASSEQPGLWQRLCL